MESYSEVGWVSHRWSDIKFYLRHVYYSLCRPVRDDVLDLTSPKRNILVQPELPIFVCLRRNIRSNVIQLSSRLTQTPAVLSMQKAQHINWRRIRAPNHISFRFGRNILQPTMYFCSDRMNGGIFVFATTLATDGWFNDSVRSRNINWIRF